MGLRSHPPIFTLLAAAVAAVLLAVAWFIEDEPATTTTTEPPAVAATPLDHPTPAAALEALRSGNAFEPYALALVAELDLDPNLVDPLADLIEDWAVAHGEASLDDPEPGADRRVAADRQRAAALAQFLGDRADAGERWIDRHVLLPEF
ncbi:hypothetical protein Pla163_34950 [Planctomycetes bacterium Pla163]|uniref:Uncharacterized protein n=1 Tax=Rohdeia mirabilis TaxID=2528008 RepID=A0A518D4F7_9BACT|nr:hypothetical protein Pla163_34950 [Planctomycetes bacterium Pla163]